MNDEEIVQEPFHPLVDTTPYQREILYAMHRLNKHIYEGTVSDKVKARRRAAGKVAKAMRKKNRLTA